MTKKCECRYNCPHGSIYATVRETGDLTMASYCHGPAGGHFVRFACIKCAFMRITEVCHECWDRNQTWFRLNSNCACEKCGESSYCQVVWTLYEDAS